MVLNQPLYGSGSRRCYSKQGKIIEQTLMTLHALQFMVSYLDQFDLMLV
ncbi:hypothetical protein AEST_04660 [Alishewanella aestuarii B11]|uniref:Uncharacterized protein n=1 Tax=Alishewanella aestuarii B11 TaxID=1197174 RepID=J1YG49_9ALTE|nr:hypothetical protein AEST_04660 [Alishewanella aestuarii B11]